MAAAGFLLTAGPVGAAERQFLVILANSPKQYPGPDREPPGRPQEGLPNPQVIRNQYFDILNPDIGSFAEYWEEVSYGDVTISGDVTDWIVLPWSIQPPLLDPENDQPDDPPVDDPGERNSPEQFFDLNGDGLYRYGQGERIDNLYAAVAIDPDGNPGGTDNGPFFVGPGSLHVTTYGYPVWKPGERFVDMDEDGRWDGLDEVNNMKDWDGNGQPDLAGPWIDLDEDREPSNSGDCIYLRDSDNDGNPDCCPNGPWDPDKTPVEERSGCKRFGYGFFDPNTCPPTRWETPRGEFADCNGNLIPDVCDIDRDDNPQAAADCAALGWAGPFPDDMVRSYDRCPREFVEGGAPIKAPDGIPDECQYQNWKAGGGCMAGPEGGEQCVELPDGLRDPRPRCEYHDSNGDRAMDIVEPFENFVRRWDPCIFDPEASADNYLENQTHWIKVYDPFSWFAGIDLTCENPLYTVDYGDDSYINYNYPAYGKRCSGTRALCSTDDQCPGKEVCRSGIEEMITESEGRVMLGSHDPLQKLYAVECKCSDGTLCPFDPDPGEEPAPPPGFVEPPGYDYEIPLRACIIEGLHIQYDPPDKWNDVIVEEGPTGDSVYTTKMQPAGCT